MKRIIVLLMTVLLVSCSGSYGGQTNSLKKVLADFNGVIPIGEHVYILKSYYNCKGCVQRLFIQIENIVNEDDLSSITIISYDKKYLSKDFLDKVDFLVDTDNSITANFPDAVNLVLIQTKDGEIIQFKVIESTDPEIYKVDVNSLFKKL